MKNTRSLAITFLTSLMGLLVIGGGLRAGTNMAAAALPPTPARVTVEEPARLDPLTSVASPGTSRVQTITLDPTPEDVMSDAWTVRQEEVFFNWTSSYVGVPLPQDVNMDSVSFGCANGTPTISFTNGYTWIIPPGSQQDWFAVSYRTRSRAIRSGDRVTLTTRTTPQQPYQSFTSTLVYTRQYPPEDAFVYPPEYWGYTVPRLVGPSSVSPPPNSSSVEEGWVQWVPPPGWFTGTVTLFEPLFGSDLTITKFLMDPMTPTINQKAYFTVTIKNIGVTTAWRWFATELYLRPTGAPPPANALDHWGGWGQYDFDALFKRVPRDASTWQIGRGGPYVDNPPLGPGQSITLYTEITVTSGVGDFRAYAQVDTGYTGPNYSWYGRVPEGYGVPPYREENNVASLGNIFIKGSRIYLPVVFKAK